MTTQTRGTALTQNTMTQRTWDLQTGQPGPTTITVPTVATAIYIYTPKAGKSQL